MNPLRQTYSLDDEFDLESTMSLLALGRGDPCLRRDADGKVRMAIASPHGAVAVHLTRNGDQLDAQLWGEDAEWLMPLLPAALGLEYQVPELEGPHRLRLLAHRFRGLRLVKTPMLFPRMVQIILQQLVTFQDACHGWRAIVRSYGTPSPCGSDLMLPPNPSDLARLAPYRFVECGVLPQHGRRITGVAREARRFDTAWSHGVASDAPDRTCQLLEKQRGIGPWTIGYLRGTAMADSDAVVLGDYGFPRHVAFFFGGKPIDADDDDMLRILEPYRPHRFYVLSLLIKGAAPPPRRGPRHRLLRDRMRPPVD